MNELQSFIQLGKRLRQPTTFAQYFEPVSAKVVQENPWYIPEFVKIAYDNLTTQLQEQNLLQLLNYHTFAHSSSGRKRIAVAIHSECPFDNFFDLLYILLSGNDYSGKSDVADKILLSTIANLLIEINPALRDRINFSDRLRNFDAIIVDETPNSATLCQYVQRFPHLIRPQCHSVAFLSGQETENQLRTLSQDIYMFFGRGALAVNELYVPASYDFVPLLHLLHEESQPIAMHNHFLNHLDYQKAIRLMNKQYYMDAGTFLFIEQTAKWKSARNPGIVNYHYYEDSAQTLDELHVRTDIQNIVSESVSGEKSRCFAKAYTRQLNDYTAGMDVLRFIEQSIQ